MNKTILEKNNNSIIKSKHAKAEVLEKFRTFIVFIINKKEIKFFILVLMTRSQRTHN